MLHLLKEYPLLSSAKSFRRSLFDPFPESLNPIDRYFICPLRRWFSFFAGNVLIHNTFNVDNYVHKQFKVGVMKSLPALFTALDKFDGDPLSDKGQILRRIMKDDIFTVFQLRHKAIAKENLTPSMSLNRIISNRIAITDISFSFGDKSHITTTIIPARTIQRFNTMTILRENASGKYYRQGGLEYYVGTKNAVAGGRNLMEHAMKGGQVFGVDVAIQCELCVSLLTRDGEDQGKQVFSSTESRPLRLRFETDHFTKNQVEDIRWRIADVDNYLISKLVDEFYRPLEDQDDNKD